jgi:hypothetical protein
MNEINNEFPKNEIDPSVPKREFSLPYLQADTLAELYPTLDVSFLIENLDFMREYVLEKNIYYDKFARIPFIKVGDKIRDIAQQHSRRYKEIFTPEIEKTNQLRISNISAMSVAFDNFNQQFSSVEDLNSLGTVFARLTEAFFLRERSKKYTKLPLNKKIVFVQKLEDAARISFNLIQQPTLINNEEWNQNFQYWLNTLEGQDSTLLFNEMILFGESVN